jgi:predicted Zn-dependent protease
MGLANYLWARGRLPEAEAMLKAAHALDPASFLTNRALAVFYLASGRQQDAEPCFRTIADTSKTSAALLPLADYYAGSKRA